MLRRFFSLAFGVAMVLVTLSVCAGFAFTPTTLDFDAQEIIASEQVEPATSTSSNPSESTSSNAINLDGVLFETWVPEQEWVVPPNQPDASTPIEIGLRVTNNGQEPIRIGKPLGIVPLLLGGDASTTFFNRLSNRVLQESDYPEIMPGESTVFSVQSRLFWDGDVLVIEGSDDYGHIWTMDPLQPNMMYLVRMLLIGVYPYAGRANPRQERNYPPSPSHLLLLEETVPANVDAQQMTINRVVSNAIGTPLVQIRIVSR
jgi:hypothetical protein